jgi:RsiW-degrading membrane proteinase PrsW (M82 family)
MGAATSLRGMTWGDARRPQVTRQVPVGPGPFNATRRPMVRRWAELAAVVVGFGMCALVLAAGIGAATGVQASLLGLVFAALPLGVVVPAFLWLDRFEAEPRRLLVFAFAWGALVASAGALVLNTSSILLLRQVEQDPLTVASVGIAPVVEESLKGSAVLLILLFRRREFDGIVDGMVYAGICAAGFAFAENILYLGRAFSEGGSAGLASVFFVRAVIGPFAHPLFTLCTGIGLGIAATTRSRALRVIAPLCGLLLAMVLHSAWNLSSVAGLNGFLAVYAFLQIPVFAGFVGVAVWARRREGRLIGQYLRPYAAAGWLSYPEVEMLARMPERRRARRWARLNGGRRSLAGMEAFQDAASDLALLGRRMARGEVDAAALATERRLLQSLAVRRQDFIGTGAF